jgi:aspartate ammonia-lyase
MNYRIEKDSLGELNISDENYWGIHTERGINNFKISGYKVNSRLITALAYVKKAALISNYELNFISDEIYIPILNSIDEIIEGKYNNQFPLDAFQGGAGTSTNMNVNEVIANLSLEKLNLPKGSYDKINPIEHINLHQSTNDVFPTALKIACIFGFRELNQQIAELQGEFNKKEKEFSHILTIGRTEMQDAVPITLGSQFASFAEAISRDRWRLFKNEERIRQVNIGGTAVGTGLTAPKKYIFTVIEKLRQLTGLGLSRAEQVMDNTANTDVFVEISGMLKANAVNLKKIALDLRFLHYQNEISLKPMQAGSSIMPGKVNPVIIEAVISSAMHVIKNDSLLSDFASMGSLQINEFMPMIAHLMLENIDILINLNRIFAEHISHIKANENVCQKHFNENESIITAFLPKLGYYKSEELIKEFKESQNSNLRDFLIMKLGMELVDEVLSTSNLMSLGYK